MVSKLKPSIFCIIIINSFFSLYYSINSGKYDDFELFVKYCKQYTSLNNKCVISFLNILSKLIHFFIYLLLLFLSKILYILPNAPCSINLELYYLSSLFFFLEYFLV